MKKTAKTHSELEVCAVQFTTKCSIPLWVVACAKMASGYGFPGTSDSGEGAFSFWPSVAILHFWIRFIGII